jgi:hypothetical protein
MFLLLRDNECLKNILEMLHIKILRVIILLNLIKDGTKTKYINVEFLVINGRSIWLFYLIDLFDQGEVENETAWPGKWNKVWLFPDINVEKMFNSMFKMTNFKISKKKPHCFIIVCHIYKTCRCNLNENYVVFFFQKNKSQCFKSLRMITWQKSYNRLLKWRPKRSIKALKLR